MTLVKKTTITTEVTVPGEKLGAFLTTTTTETQIEETFSKSEWAQRFGEPVGMSGEEVEELPPL